MLEDINGEPARHVGEELDELLLEAQYVVIQSKTTYL